MLFNVFNVVPDDVFGILTTVPHVQLTQQPNRTPRNKKLLGAPGIATRSKDATRGSWPYY